MIKLITASILFLLIVLKTQISVFDLSITTPDGNEQLLNSFQGKQLMVVVLPVTYTAADTALLQLLDTLNTNYSDSITMIGIPSIEDGYTDDDKNNLMDWYRSYLGESFIIGAGVYIHKTSPSQSPLFSYFTHADQNGYFDEDVYGPGEKFFVDVNGNLNGVSTPDAEFNEDIFKSMISK